MRPKNKTYFIWMKKKIKLEPAIIWKLVTCQRITSKKYLTSMGHRLSPRYGQVILVSGYPVLTAVNWSQHWCAICEQYQSSSASKLATKYEWTLVTLWCGRTGGRCTVTWIPNFLGWVDLLSYGAALTRALRAWRTEKNEGRRNAHASCWLIETRSSSLCLQQVAGTWQRVKSHGWMRIAQFAQWNP